MKKLKISKTRLLVSGAIILTLANSSGLGYALIQRRKATDTTGRLQEVIKPKIDIKNAKKHDTNPTLVGKKIGEGEYRSETLKQSKIKKSDSAQLSVASHQQTGGHFVLAFLSGGNIPTPDQLGPGWKLETIADDPMWAPGACSSKPTFLIGGKYIFIDDGKTSDDDKYNSYIVFDMTTAEYKYFGGNNFTQSQGTKEEILTTTNENDKIVFYIDPVDDQPYITDNSQSGHTKGKDHAYVIRREIDPVTLKYTDYSLPFNVPDDLTNYYISASVGQDGVSFTVYSPYGSGTDISYTGSVVSNSIKLTNTSMPNYDPNAAQTFDSVLELKLDNVLRESLAGFVQQNPPYEGSQYKTVFTVFEQGSYQQLQFLNVSQRYGSDQEGSTVYYSTPLIFDNGSNQSYPMVLQPILRNSRDYVNLGVF